MSDYSKLIDYLKNVKKRELNLDASQKANTPWEIMDNVADKLYTIGGYHVDVEHIADEAVDNAGVCYVDDINDDPDGWSKTDLDKINKIRGDYVDLDTEKDVSKDDVINFINLVIDDLSTMNKQTNDDKKALENSWETVVNDTLDNNEPISVIKKDLTKVQSTIDLMNLPIDIKEHVIDKIENVVDNGVSMSSLKPLDASVEKLIK